MVPRGGVVLTVGLLHTSIFFRFLSRFCHLGFFIEDLFSILVRVKGIKVQQKDFANIKIIWVEGENHFSSFRAGV